MNTSVQSCMVEEEPCQETHKNSVMLGGHTGSLSVQPKISTLHSAWLPHGGHRKIRTTKGIWHLESMQPSDRGVQNRVPWDTSYAWRLQLRHVLQRGKGGEGRGHHSSSPFASSKVKMMSELMLNHCSGTGSSMRDHPAYKT